MMAANGVALKDRTERTVLAEILNSKPPSALHVHNTAATHGYRVVWVMRSHYQLNPATLHIQPFQRFDSSFHLLHSNTDSDACELGGQRLSSYYGQSNKFFWWRKVER
jgi:hypothetical protein